MNTYLVFRLAISASTMLLLAGLLLMRHNARQRRVDQRFDQVHSGGSVAGDRRGSGTGDALKVLSGVGQGIIKSGAVSSQNTDALRKLLISAGIRGENAVGTFIASKIILAVVLPVLMFVLLHNWSSMPMMRNMLIGAGAVVGLLLPDFIVKSMRKRYGNALSNGLPDALDMMVMCAESGLSLEPAIGRVGMEIHAAHPAIGTEFLLTASEFQISTDSTGVLANLAGRTGLNELKRIVATLTQTLQYGTPLAEALRVLSAEMRTEILTRFEERAAKLPVLLTLPMILFILPCLFLVVGGPAVLQAMRLFSAK